MLTWWMLMPPAGFGESWPSLWPPGRRFLYEMVFHSLFLAILLTEIRKFVEIKVV